jgi:hypothetical protein
MAWLMQSASIAGSQLNKKMGSVTFYVTLKFTFGVDLKLQKQGIVSKLQARIRKPRTAGRHCGFR